MNEIIREGDVVEGRITGIQPYGVFLKLNDVCSGLVHASELERLGKGSTQQTFKIGQTLKVKILRIKPSGKQAVLRVHYDIGTKGRMRAGNFETQTGFASIRKQLDIWVQEAKDRRYI